MDAGKEMEEFYDQVQSEIDRACKAWCAVYESKMPRLEILRRKI